MAESIGSTLKQKREARHLSIEQVAEQTRVRTYYLQALENDDLSAIPSMVQARGFLRIYAEFLSLNLDELSFTNRLTESQPDNSQVASSPEPLAAPVQSNEPASDSQSRPSFLGGLRDRFARRSSDEVPASEPEPVVPSESQSKPEEVFVPVRTHEELPAAPEEVSAPQVEQIVLPEPVAVKPARVRKPSSRKASAKKPVRAKPKTKSTKQTTKSSKTNTGKKTPVKKKITAKKKTLPKKKISLKNLPRPKRVLSPRKSSFSRPRRRLTKPKRKAAKPLMRKKSHK